MAICYLHRNGGTTKGCINSVLGEHLTIDSFDRPLHNLKIFGKTTQLTTTGKNLLPFRPKIGAPIVNAGVTYTLNADGSITANGTASGISNLAFVLASAGPIEVPAGEYIISGMDGANTKFYFTLYDGQNNSATRYDLKNSGELRVTLKSGYIFNPRMVVLDGTTMNNVTFHPMMRKASVTDATYEPGTGGIPSPNLDYPQGLETVGADGNITVTVCGKNLLNIPDTTAAADGVSVAIKNGVITLNGTAPKNTFFTFQGCASVLKGQTYYYGTEDVTGLKQFLGVNAGSYGTEPTFRTNSNRSRLMPEGGTLTYQLFIQSGATFNNTVVKPYLTLGSSAIDWKPYKGHTLTAQTPNGLPGIPVSSGGNYIDENGQMWWCDTVNFRTSKMERRVITAVLDGTQRVAAFSASNSTTHNRIWINIGAFSSIGGTFGHLCSHIGVYGDSYSKTNWFVTKATSTAPSYIALTLPKEIGNTKEAVCAWLADNPITVAVGRSDIQYEGLTAEQIAQYSALHTNYPNTIIYNDAGAGMEVSYYEK